MSVNPQEREKYLHEFLEMWPLSRIAAMKLEEYIDIGNKETLAWWLEFGPGRYLGSNAGGDASKFGIYMRGAPPKGDRGFIQMDAKYSWKKKYGNTAERSFTKIKENILNVIDAASKGDLLYIQQLDFETSLKWKLAFIYQDQNQPTVLPIYKLIRLKELCGLGKADHATAYQILMAKRGEIPVLTYGFDLWAQMDQAEVDDDDDDDEEQTETEWNPSYNQATPPLNQILYGPPGTGKTYNTIDKALEILDPQFLAQNSSKESEARAALKARFDVLMEEERIAFVTFHQSFSYEDFVEGIRASMDDSIGSEDQGTQLAYRIEDGVFKRICASARRERATEEELGVNPQARIWKISIEDANSNGNTRQYCFEHDEARIGWADVGDLNYADLDDPEHNLKRNARNSLAYFSREAKPGDILLCLASITEICAVGVVTGTYEYQPIPPSGVRKDYVQRLPVKWLLNDIRFNIITLNDNCTLRPMTMYPLWRINISDLFSALRTAGHRLSQRSVPQQLPHVLIVDEINRGNVSRIFGELITLIEASKRSGATEALEVTLPYSKKRFSVPNNLWIIGTMNTADRSLAGLDIALRRRFNFIEMLPNYQLLANVDVVHDGKSVNIGKLLEVMNQRIEVLLDRDHCIGHALMMPLHEEPTLERLAVIFCKQIIPLMQEYFFEDWERISWVLNDDEQREKSLRFISQWGGETALEKLFGARRAQSLALNDRRWQVNHQALENIDSYRLIIGEA